MSLFFEHPKFCLLIAVSRSSLLFTTSGTAQGQVESWASSKLTGLYRALSEAVLGPILHHELEFEF